MALPEGVEGSCAPRFAAVAEVLASQLASGEHSGAAVAVRHRGAPVVDLWGGSFSEHSLAVSFSTTKGVVAVAVHMALERAGVAFDTPVAQLWPEFGAAGKAAVTVRQLLCHEAGVPQVRDQVADVWAMADWDAMMAMVAGLETLWEPGTANGYHAVTWGWLAGEVLRRVDGRLLPQFLAEEVAGPLGLDGCFVGTPEAEHHRVVPLALGGAAKALGRLEDYLPADSITVRALAPRGDIVEFVNSPVGLSSCVPAVTGAFTARSLATVYAALERGGALDGVRLLSPEAVAAATTVQNTRPDLVLILPMHWRLGFMSGGLGNPRPGRLASGAYGHAGFGGSLAMAYPGRELTVAVTLDRLGVDLLGDDRSRRVIAAALAAAADD